MNPFAAANSICRREALRIGIATASLALISGCASFGGSKSELDDAGAELQDLLSSFAENETEQARLLAIGSQIAGEAKLLVGEQQTLLNNFDSLSRNPEVRGAELQRIVDEWDASHIRVRNDLFRLQEELRGELTQAEWDRAVNTLNKKARYMRRTDFLEA